MSVRIFSIILIIKVLLPFFSLGQREEKAKYARTLSISAFIEELQNPNIDSVIIRNVNIRADLSTDRRYLRGATNMGRKIKWDSLLQNYPLIVTDKVVWLENVYVEQSTIFPKIIFKKMVHLEQVNVYGDLTFHSCVFEGFFHCVNSNSFFLNFKKNAFKRGAYFESVHTSLTEFSGCTFQGGIEFFQNSVPVNINFSNNRVLGYCAFRSAKVGGELVISESVFEPESPQNTVIIGGEFGFLNRLTLTNNTFRMPLDFSGTNLKDNFVFSKCVIPEQNSFRNISLPESSTNARWAYFKDYKFGIPITDTTYFTGNKAISDSTEEEYFELIKVYSQFLRAYKNNGDQESYNACYIEMKDIQTRKAAFNFRKEPSISNYFEWKLNRFLKLFCDYGTNPVKALLMSAVVIFIFGILYFFFPSEDTAFQPQRFWQDLKKYSAHKRAVNTQVKMGLKQLLNAMALSMNAYVTLGYGDMPARGIARYLAVLEGLTGWFLLSIFSSSLISQILQ
jgi:Ion channel